MDDRNAYSVEQLVQFGIGVSIAQQMVQSMNLAISNVIGPGRPLSPSGQQASASYHVLLDEKPAGPFSESELMRLINEQRLTKETFVWRPGLKDWERAENMPDILRLVALCPPPFTERPTA